MIKHNKATVLITGSSSGIGYATALTFARHGYTVFATMRDTRNNQASTLRAIADRENLSLQIVQLDITDQASIKKIVTILKDKDLSIDFLINNAGFGYVGPVEVFSIEEAKEQFETNVFGTLRMMQAILPMMRTRKSGMIITVSSIHGFLSFPLWGIYAASKHAIEAYTEALRFEISQFGINVVLIEPGAFLSNFTKNRKFPQYIEKEDDIYKKLTLSFFKKFDALAIKAEKNIFLSKLMSVQQVADRIYNVSREKNPRMRYRVGIDAHVYYYIKQMLPESLWQAIIKKVYHL